MITIEYPERSNWSEILKRPVFDQKNLESTVSEVLENVRINGDAALREYALKFDQVSLTNLLVTKEEIQEANTLVSETLKQAIEEAKNNIDAFHKAQYEIPNKIETTPGVTCWRESRPIEKVGLYIPGGTAPLFSTILMLVIPAKIAGCQEIVLSTPPNKEGKIHPAILYTANVLGVTKIVKSGGAQAIAAMAYGTESVPKVFKIFGPGNQYVTCAKQLVSKDGTAIDMPAGPSEVMVVGDETANPAFIASDLLSQAEHGADSQVIYLTRNAGSIAEINKAIEEQLSVLPRKELASKALENSKAILVQTEEELVDMINLYAPEHLIIQTKEYHNFISKIINAGSVFLGHYTPESAGDYASGTNHTLPTNGYATAYSGVSLDSFIKKVTFQEISAKGLQSLGPSIEIMAEEEQLMAHKNAVTLRLKSLG